MSEIQSKVYQPNPRKCCEACAFGSGEHARFCVVYWRTAWEREREWLQRQTTRDLRESVYNDGLPAAAATDAG